MEETLWETSPLDRSGEDFITDNLCSTSAYARRQDLAERKAETAGFAAAASSSGLERPSSGVGLIPSGAHNPMDQMDG